MEPGTRDRPGLPVVVLATIAVLVTAADTYVVVLALPDILTGVGVGLDELQRATPIIGGFLLGYTATLPLLGRLADLRGRVPVLVGCLLLFALGSLLTATADGLGPAVIGRGLQGIGAGGLVPATLALVADRWPPERRALPLGVVGAVQEAGAVLGPLAGAAVLAVADWRAIFWLNLLLGLGLAVGVLVAARGRRPDPVGLVLAAVTGLAVALQLAAPAALAEDVTLGLLYVPVVPAVEASTPLVLVAIVAGAGLVARSLDRTGRRRPAAARAAPPGTRGRRRSGRRWLSCPWAVWCGRSRPRTRRRRSSPTDRSCCRSPWPRPSRSSCTSGAPPIPCCRCGRCARPAPGGRCWSTCWSGSPWSRRSSTSRCSPGTPRRPGDQLGAALVLLRLLVAVPVGAVAGGWLCRTVAPRLIAAGGMTLTAVAFVAMTTWDARSLDGAASYVVLLAAGFGFGLAIAPVNAVLLAVTGADVHGSASALAVVARTVGMLGGLSLLTAVALRRFTAEVDAIGTPFQLCPDSPADCPAYDAATDAAILTQLHTVFAGAAIAAGLAAVAALLLLRDRSPRTGAWWRI